MSSSYGQLIKDLQIGFEEGEKVVQGFIREHFGIKTKNVGHKHLGWDLEFEEVDPEYLEKFNRKNEKQVKKGFINKFGTKFEIKRDKASDRTNNFFFEVWSNIRVHNPGCINISKADTLVLVRNKEFIFINRGFFISWIIFNLYNDTPMCKRWKRKTCGKVKEVELKNSSISPHVRGLLIPVDDIRKEACIEVFKR